VGKPLYHDKVFNSEGKKFLGWGREMDGIATSFVSTVLPGDER
jgi:hypothetical protein